jgi:hypothetical protein
VEDSWRPVLAINDRNLVMGITQNGTWVVGGDSMPVTPVAERLVALLPLLERPHRDIVATVAEQVTSLPGPPWTGLLEYALRSPSGYWPGLALGWLEDGHPVTGLLDVLAEFTETGHRSQPLRHRAARLLKAARGGPVGPS